MIIESEYSIGQKVWVFHTKACVQQVQCKTCNATGQVTFLESPGRRISCPDCRGRGSFQQDDRFKVYEIRELTVGYINITVKGGEQAERIMCDETGLGSGSVYGHFNPARRESHFSSTIAFPSRELCLEAAQSCAMSSEEWEAIRMLPAPECENSGSKNYQPPIEK